MLPCIALLSIPVCQVVPCLLVLAFEAPEHVLTERLLLRGRLSGRIDDNEETISKRLATFSEKTQPVIEYYQQQGKLFTVRIVLLLAICQSHSYIHTKLPPLCPSVVLFPFLVLSILTVLNLEHIHKRYNMKTPLALGTDTTKKQLMEVV